MRFFTNRLETEKKDEKNSDADDEEFHSIFEIDDLKNLDPVDMDDIPSDISSKGKKTIESPIQTSNINTRDTDAKNSILTSDEFSEEKRTIEAFDQRLRNELKGAIIWNNKGVILSRLGKYTEAIEAYDQALMIDPNYSSAWNNKGVTLSRLGKYTEAIEAYDRALMIELNYSAVYENQLILKVGVLSDA